jgi:hypothetical protein
MSSLSVPSTCSSAIYWLDGRAHDSRVLRDAIAHHGFLIPARKYFLGDAGSSNAEYLLVPRRGVRYHLKEQRLASERYVLLYSLRSLLTVYRPQNLHGHEVYARDMHAHEVHACEMIVSGLHHHRRYRRFLPTKVWPERVGRPPC